MTVTAAASGRLRSHRVGDPKADNTLNLFNSAIALGDNTSALSAGFVSNSLAAGRNTTAISAGLGSMAADIGDNTYKGSGSATAVGLANRAINLGGDNTAVVTSAFPPVLDLAHPETLSIGNNSVINIGKGNFGAVQDGFSTGVYQIGDRNQGAARGILSNVLQVGNDNHGPLGKHVPVNPNVAAGLGAINLVLGNRNAQNVIGNLAVGTTVGDDNKNDVVDPALLGPDAGFNPSFNNSNVFGSGNKVSSFGQRNFTDTIGDRNGVDVAGNGNVTTTLGNDNQVTPKKKWQHYTYPGVKVRGDNNVTTTAGNENTNKVFGNSNLTSVFGNRSRALSTGDGNVTNAVGDDQSAHNGTNNDN